MFKLLTILWNSFKMALGELKNNKLRSGLSLLGVTFGIFCVIGVLATVDSLQQKVQGDLSSLGNNSVWLDKWEYGQGNGGSYPWWKYINRPAPKHNEVEMIKQRSQLAEYVAHFLSSNATLSYKNFDLSGVGVYGITEDFNKIQTIDIVEGGRYLSEADFKRGTSVAVIGYEVAEDLIGNPENAAGKQISVNGRHVAVVGVIKKQGQSFVGGFDYDNCVIVSYQFYASMFNVNQNGFGGNNLIMIKAKDGIPSSALVEDLRGAMRQIRKLSPTQEDNFALNDINMFSEQAASLFGVVNLAGWVIAGLSLIVGGFGVANIMFVTVRERTSQIGLKKAIGAKRSTILFEFLLESAFLCIIGGLVGLFFVQILALVLSSVLPFPIFIGGRILLTALIICVILGVISGIIPAFIAAKMNPVKAIRTT
jgi:putative ABC transport system permease protein